MPSMYPAQIADLVGALALTPSQRRLAEISASVFKRVLFLVEIPDGILQTKHREVALHELFPYIEMILELTAFQGAELLLFGVKNELETQLEKEGLLCSATPQDRS